MPAGVPLYSGPRDRGAGRLSEATVDRVLYDWPGVRASTPREVRQAILPTSNGNRPSYASVAGPSWSASTCRHLERFSSAARAVAGRGTSTTAVPSRHLGHAAASPGQRKRDRRQTRKFLGTRDNRHHRRMSIPDDQQVLQVAERRARALAARDSEALQALLHPSLQWTTFQGEVLSREQYIAGNTGDALTWRSQQLDRVRVVVVGDTAVLTALVTDEVQRDGRDHMFRLRLTQTWVRVGSGWQCLAGHAGPEVS